MGRHAGDYHWTKCYLTLQEMADDMKETFSLAQLESYARGYRKPSPIIHIIRRQDRVLSHAENRARALKMLKYKQLGLKI